MTETDTNETQTWTVPLIDPDTGDGWDVEITAESPHEAMQKTPTDAHIARPFIEEHIDTDLP